MKKYSILRLSYTNSAAVYMMGYGLSKLFRRSEYEEMYSNIVFAVLYVLYILSFIVKIQYQQR